MQRALMHWFKPYNRELVIKALKKAGREDLIGWGKECLIAPREIKRKDKEKKRRSPEPPKNRRRDEASQKKRPDRGKAGRRR